MPDDRKWFGFSAPGIIPSNRRPAVSAACAQEHLRCRDGVSIPTRLDFLLFPFQFIVINYLPPYLCETFEAIVYRLG